MKILFRERFPGHEMFLEKLLAQKRFNARHHLHEIIALARLYHKDDVLRAFDTALEYNVFTVSFLSGYLAKNFQQSFDLTPPPSRVRHCRPPQPSAVTLPTTGSSMSRPEHQSPHPPRARTLLDIHHHS